MSQETGNINEETALAVRKRDEALAANPALRAEFNSIEVLRQKAAILVDSGFLPEVIKNWQQAAAIMMRAEELDIEYWTALQHINVIKGNPQPDGQLTLALMQRSGLLELYQVVESTEERCTIRFKRRGQPAFDLTCTLQEYEKVAGPDGKRQPRTHLFWYTAKKGGRMFFSDVLNNMHRKRGQQVIVENDLPTDVPDDDVYVVEEGDFREGEAVRPSAPLSLSLSGSSASADDDSDDALLQKLAGLTATTAGDERNVGAELAEIPSVGALNMNSLYERALSGKLVKNEFHFGNLLTLLMREGSIRDAMTADQVLDAMKRHKAAKELRGETDSVPEVTA